MPDIQFDEKELDMILSHELIHLKRGDLFIKLIIMITKAVHWFNPAVYLLSRQINNYCELSCDEMVVRKMDMDSRKSYGEMILSMLDYAVMKRDVSNMVCVSSLCNSKNNMKRRLINLMNVKKMKKSMVVLSVAAAVLLTGVGSYIAYGAAEKIPTTEVAREKVKNLTENMSSEYPEKKLYK